MSAAAPARRGLRARRCADAAGPDWRAGEGGRAGGAGGRRRRPPRRGARGSAIATPSPTSARVSWSRSWPVRPSPTPRASTSACGAARCGGSASSTPPPARSSGRSRLTPDHAQSHVTLGKLYMMTRKLDLALREAARAQSLEPGNYRGHLIEAMTRDAAGEGELALAAAERTLERKPGEEQAQAIADRWRKRLGKSPRERAAPLPRPTQPTGEEDREAGRGRMTARRAAVREKAARIGDAARRAVPAAADPARPPRSLHAAGRGGAVGAVHRRAGQPGHAGAVRARRRRRRRWRALPVAEHRAHHPAVRPGAGQGEEPARAVAAAGRAPRRRRCRATSRRSRRCPASATRPPAW